MVQEIDLAKLTRSRSADSKSGTHVKGMALGVALVR